MKRIRILAALLATLALTSLAGPGDLLAGKGGKGEVVVAVVAARLCPRHSR